MSGLLTRMVLGARKPPATIQPVLTPGYAYRTGAPDVAESARLEQALEGPATTAQHVSTRGRADTRVDAPERRDLTTLRQSPANRDAFAADRPMRQEPLAAVVPTASRPAALRRAAADDTDTHIAEVSQVQPSTRAAHREADDTRNASPVRSANATALTPPRMSVDRVRPTVPPPPQTVRTARRTLGEQRPSHAAASSRSAKTSSPPLNVTVSIGHIEVRTPAPQTKTRGFRPRLTLGDFLQGRSVRT
jgi:hypothetical protein